MILNIIKYTWIGDDDRTSSCYGLQFNNRIVELFDNDKDSDWIIYEDDYHNIKDIEHLSTYEYKTSGVDDDYHFNVRPDYMKTESYHTLFGDLLI